MVVKNRQISKKWAVYYLLYGKIKRQKIIEYLSRIVCFYLFKGEFGVNSFNRINLITNFNKMLFTIQNSQYTFLEVLEWSFLNLQVDY